MPQIETKLQDILEAKLNRRPAVDESFDELGIDSLTMAEVIAEIETAFSVRTNDGMLDTNNIRELAEYLSKLGVENE